MTCKKMKIGQQKMFSWEQLVVNRNFALAREINHDPENGYFRKCLLDHEYFVSGKSFVSFYYLVRI